MTWGHAGLVLIMAGCGFLAWRGTRSIWKAIAAGIIVPLVGIVVLAFLIPVAWREHLDVAMFLALLVGVVAYLVLANQGER